MHIYYCIECIDRIYQHFDVFHNLCRICLYTKRPLELCLDHNETRADAVKILSKMRKLEKLGYVLTTETAKYMISIRPLGIDSTEEGKHVFCLARDHVKQNV